MYVRGPYQSGFLPPQYLDLTMGLNGTDMYISYASCSRGVHQWRHRTPEYYFYVLCSYLFRMIPLRYHGPVARQLGFPSLRHFLTRF